MKKNEEVTVNDGNGLYDNVGMCDVIATDINSLIRILFGGNMIQFCQKVSEIATKLSNLKQGIKSDLASKDRVIEELKRINDELAKEIKKDGVTNGAD